MGAITRNFANNILGTGQLDATDGVDGNVPAPNVNNESLDNITALPPAVGFGIKTVSSDPPSLNEGEIFFNSTTGTFKSLVNVSAFSSQIPYPAAQSEFSGAGTATAAIFVAGSRPPPGYTNECHTWDGIGFSNIANYPETQYGSATLGITTAALSFGGRPPSPPAFNQVTAEFNGTSWTTSGNYPTVIRNASTAGTQTAGLGFTGNLTNPGSPYKTNISAEYDGSSWTVGNTVNTERRNATGGGTQTAALLVGGFGDPGGSTISAFEKYDGTSWTSDPASLNTGRYGHTTQMGVTGDNAITAGGATPSLTGKAEQYNGTSWSETGDMATARNMCAGSGTSTTHLALGGSGPGSPLANVEEFNTSTFSITAAAAWASGGNLNVGRDNMYVFGSQTASVGAGGYNHPPGHRNLSEEYDGTSWTEGNNLNTARSAGAASGSLTAGIIYAGSTGSNTDYAETYDGTSYSEVNDLSTGRRLLAGSTNSPQSTATAFGGYVSAASNLTEEFDGTNWTAGGTMSGGRYKLGGAGTQTAALAFGGIPAPGGSSQTATEEYDGSSWTSGGSLLTAANQNAGNGTQTAALSYGGTPNVTTTVGYDGTSWSTRPSLGTGRGYLKGCGTSISALATGGNNPSYSVGTEEFTGETSAQTASTIQSS